MKPKLTIRPLTTPALQPDGTLTPLGISLIQTYAQRWLKGDRDTALENARPELLGQLYDIRTDIVRAQYWAHE